MSAIPAVKAALTDVLKEALPNAQVTYGHPGKNIGRECAFIGATDDWDQEWAGIGASARDERFALVLYVNVRRRGDSQREATERAFELLADIETAFVAAQDLDGLLVTSANLTFRRFDEPFDDEGREAQIEASVRCRARI